MRLILLIICLYWTQGAQARNFYFSSLTGNDSRTTSESQDPATPWKTLDKLNSFFGNLKPGDSILLKRGEVFYGAIVVKKSGSTTLPIVIGAYGVGNKPIITSLITLSGWVARGYGIWETVDSTLSSTVNTVLLNGVDQEMGRYPNSNASNKGYLNFEGHIGKTAIIDNELTTAKNWKGAELVTRPRHWILNRSLITGHSGDTISYTTSSPYAPYQNYGYFIQNSSKTLDRQGEWYYNPSLKKLSIFFGSADPASFIVQATSRGNLISANNCSNIVFDSLSIQGSNASGFIINNGSGIHIQNCDILYSSVTGIFAGNHKDLQIENCTIANSNNNAINLAYGISNAVIKNNKISNTALFAGMMQNGEGNGLAIYVNGDGNIVESNDIRNTGFIGIFFYGNDVIIKNNIIDSFCFVKDDGGGIYSHGGTALYENRKITGNIVTNGIGAGKGTDIADKRSVTGIYMDANITNVEISGNTVTTCFQGIFIQSSAGMIIKNNTVFDNTRQLIIIQRAGANPVRNSVISQNIFFAKTQDQFTSFVTSSADDIKLFGWFDSNYYARPLDDRLTLYNSYIGANGTVTQNLDVEAWRRISNHDEHSKKTARQIAPYKLYGFKGPNKCLGGDGSFTFDIEGLAGSGCDVLRVDSGMLDGGCIQVTPTSRVSSLYVKVGDIAKNKNYILKFSLKGSTESDMSIGAFLKQAGAPFTTLTPTQSRRVDYLRTEHEMLFTPAVSNSSTYLIFKIDAKNIYYIDNIALYEASVKVTKPDDSIRFEYNPTHLNKQVNLDGNYIDAPGNLYTGKIALKPFSSAVLIRVGNNVTNHAPFVKISSPENDTVFSAFSNVSINAIASDTDGTIEKVEFYRDSLLVKTAEGPEYTFTLDSLAPGSYSITAKATDNNGAFTLSPPVNFSVASPNVPPAVSIITPANNAVFSPFTSVYIQAQASDIDGSVAKVEFYNDSTLLKTINAGAYNFTLDSLAPGNYHIIARATDDKGAAMSSSPVNFLINASSVPPVVNITTPANNAIYLAGANVYLKATATDADGTIKKLQFYNGAKLLFTANDTPYSFKWEHVNSGKYTLTARATDNSNLVATSALVYITVVPNAPPTVNLINPLQDQAFTEGTTIKLQALSADSDGRITRVEFYDGLTLLATKYAAPYVFNWKNVLPGNYSLMAVARDNWGAATSSLGTNISVTALPAAQQARGSGVNDLATPGTSMNVLPVRPVLAEETLNNTISPTENQDVLKRLDVAKVPDFRLLPNPAAETVQVYFRAWHKQQKVNLIIKSASGTILKKYPLIISGKKIDVDISTLSSGIYTISLSGKYFSVSKQFIKGN